MTASPKVLEKNFWADWVKPRLRAEGAFARRLENLSGSGEPDVTAIRNGWVLRVELKTCARPARETTRLAVTVQGSQPLWHDLWSEHGGLSVWLVQVGSGLRARRYALRGPLGSQLAAGLTEPELAVLGTHVGGDNLFGRLLSVARGDSDPVPFG